MNWIALIATVLPIILECLDQNTAEDVIRDRMRNPKERDIRKIRRQVKRDVRRNEPELRRRERRVRVDTLVDGVVARAHEATDSEIDAVLLEARSRR